MLITRRLRNRPSTLFLSWNFGYWIIGCSKCCCNLRRNYCWSALQNLPRRGLYLNLRKLLGRWRFKVVFYSSFNVFSIKNLSTGLSSDLVHFAVRKVKTSLDPPTGCSMSSLRPQAIKLESIRYRLSSLQSSLSSGWRALQKIRCVPRAPANRSFSRQSLAYVHAGTQYIKQVSGLLKSGVTSLRNSSSSYDIVQGALFVGIMHLW